MKKLTFLLLSAIIGLSSCTSPKYMAVNQLRTLSEDLSVNYSNYGLQDWKKVKDRYDRINDKLNMYNYTNEEKAEIGELQGRCVGYFAKGALETVIDKATGVVNQASGIVKGVMDSFGKKTPNAF